MTSTFTSRVGGIVSADIAVPEHEREVRFYSRILTTGAKPLWRADLMNNRGMPVDVATAPDALRLARREADHVALVVARPTHAVDPAEAQGLLDRLLPRDRRLAGGLLVVGHVEGVG